MKKEKSFTMVSEQQGAVAVNKFKDEILGSIGEIPVSGTQSIRVLKVWDENNKEVKLSVQKWWRPSKDAEWIAGKGFKLNKSQAEILSTLLEKGTMEF